MLTVAALSPSLDLTYSLEHYRTGQMHRTPGPFAVAGGKALNMARAARAMGAEVVVVTLLGGPTGARVAALAEAEGMPLVEVASGVETRTCVSVAAADTGELTEIYEDSRPVEPEVLQDLAAAVAEQLATRPGWLSISGRGPSGSADAVAELVRLGRSEGASVAVDTHGETLPGAAAARPALVKINRAEAAELLGRSATTDLVMLATQIQSRTGALVVLTDGTAGAVALDENEVVQVAPPARHGRFPVGSGDAFLGGLLAALDRGDDLAAAVRLGTGCAVANALVPGQGYFDAALAVQIAAETRFSERRPASSSP